MLVRRAMGDRRAAVGKTPGTSQSWPRPPGARPLNMSDHALSAQRSALSAVNDFAFKIGTVNGTDSASTNSLLMQAVFRMGIPVTGKIVFPSNIQGLPTWYEIRVSKDGYTARPEEMDLVVALNPETYRKDVAAVRAGGYLLYDSSWPLDDALVREGITIMGVPFGK